MALEATGVVIAELERRAPTIGRARRIGRLVRSNPLGFLGLVLILIFGVFAVFAPLIAPYPPKDYIVGADRLSPSLHHLFGTDHIGHDMFSRVVYGSRISLTVGFLSVIFGTVTGAVIGVFSGYTGGTIDSLIQRAVDTWLAFPVLLLLLILRQVLGPSLKTLIVVIGIAIIPGVARVVRGAVLSERNNQYIEAARALGASTPRILFLHITPNILALAIVLMTTLLGTAILAEASLAFLGLSIPSAVTWGGDVSAARETYPYDLWWAFFPGLAISLTVLGFNLFGDSLRDILDPRLRGRL